MRILLGAFAVIALLAGCQKPEVLIEYGPRWVDYEEWGKLDLSMDKGSVVRLLGEPYMTSEGSYPSEKKSITYIYKFRVKHYPLKRLEKKEVSWDPRSKPTLQGDIETKPEKFSDTKVWGKVYDAFLTFENDKLIKWTVPQLKNISDFVNDSLKVKIAQ